MNKNRFPKLDTSKYKYCDKCDKILPLSHFEVTSVNENKTKFYKQICKRCEQGKQFNRTKPEKIKILNEDGAVQLTEDIIGNDTPINVKLINIFETFVQIEGTTTYWISNYGRVVDNIRNPFEFYVHKMTDRYTIYEIEADGGIYKYNASTDSLVGKMFLKNPNKYTKIWHLDGDISNCYYKNLIYLSGKDYMDLKNNKKAIEDMEINQEYYEYPNKARRRAYDVYSAIYNRCYNNEKYDNIHKCYDKAVMCDEWLDNPESFVDWYLENYYSVKNESMAVDKDLFGKGSYTYSPSTCCLLPQGLNTMMANSKKHYKDGENKDNTLPLGVRHNSKNNTYYGEITFTNREDATKLSEWSTPEEAFEEYKLMKQADIRLVAAYYKDKIPGYIYDELLKVEVKPY